MPRDQAYEVTVKIGKRQAKVNVTADTPGEAMAKAEMQFATAIALGEEVHAFKAQTRK